MISGVGSRVGADGALRSALESEAKALGIKTGNTPAAGNCLLFEAKRDGRTLIGVVLHAGPTSNPVSAIVAARQVLNWGFRHFG